MIVMMICGANHHYSNQ